MKLRVQELYESIHGEFPYIGKPVTIVRLAGCNLTCSYCDAPNDKGKEMELDDIVDRVLDYDNQEVLITGGEPLLQLKGVKELLSRLSPIYRVVIETNGTMPIEDLGLASIAMDVKLEQGRSYPQEVLNLEYLTAKDVVKFVYWDLASYSQAWRFIYDNIVPGFKSKLVFSPVYPNEAFVEDFIQRVKDYPCYDIRIQVQIHKYLSCG